LLGDSNDVRRRSKKEKKNGDKVYVRRGGGMDV